MKRKKNKLHYRKKCEPYLICCSAVLVQFLVIGVNICSMFFYLEFNVSSKALHWDVSIVTAPSEGSLLGS